MLYNSWQSNEPIFMENHELQLVNVYLLIVTDMYNEIQDMDVNLCKLISKDLKHKNIYISINYLNIKQ